MIPEQKMALAQSNNFPFQLQSTLPLLEQLENLHIKKAPTELEAFQEKLETSFTDSIRISQLSDSFQIDKFTKAKGAANEKLMNSYVAKKNYKQIDFSKKERPRNEDIFVKSSYLEQIPRNEPEAKEEPIETDSNYVEINISIQYKGEAPTNFRHRFNKNSLIADVANFIINTKKFLTREEMSRCKIKAGMKTLDLLSSIQDFSYDKEVLKFELENFTSKLKKEKQEEIKSLRSSPIIINDIDFETRPNASVLKNMTDEELSHVEGFSVFNKFGRIDFLRPVDLRGCDLQKNIVIRFKFVQVLGETQTKVPVGTSLNQPAKITYNLFEFPKNPEKMAKAKEKLKAMAQKMNADLIEIDENAGKVVIKINNF